MFKFFQVEDSYQVINEAGDVIARCDYAHDARAIADTMTLAADMVNHVKNPRGSFSYREAARHIARAHEQADRAGV